MPAGGSRPIKVARWKSLVRCSQSSSAASTVRPSSTLAKRTTRPRITLSSPAGIDTPGSAARQRGTNNAEATTITSSTSTAASRARRFDPGNRIMFSQYNRCTSSHCVLRYRRGA